MNGDDLSGYMQQLWVQWGQSILAEIPHIIQAIVIGILTLLLAGRLQRVVERLTAEGHRRRELGRLLGRLSRIAIIFGGLLIILGIFGQTQLLASFIASLGIFGLLIAFALQDITKNFAAGVLLLLQRPFGLDDRIRVEPFEGVVTDITLRATVLRTLDGQEVLIPNAQVYSGAITNLTRYPLRRYTVPITLPLSVEPADARQVLAAALAEVKGIEAHPAPHIAATVVGKEDYTLEARFWVHSRMPEMHMVVSGVTLALQQAVQKIRNPEPVDEAV
jgi:small-conductance mechanosensitive channel